MTERPAPRWCVLTIAFVQRHARGLDGAMLAATGALLGMMACRVGWWWLG